MIEIYVAIYVLACVSFLPFEWAFPAAKTLTDLHFPSSSVHAKVPEESPIFRRRHILGEVRAVSVDRYKYPLSEDYQHRVASPLASRPSIPHHHLNQQQPQLPFKPSPGEARFGKNKNHSWPRHKTMYFLSQSHA